ncbi:MAG: Glu-tRNA(Gln) amidotransferase subunit GatE [Candidatus Altiarchaeales archaeon]|nr:Glu-tRNA(Gln) amidotransferase subunit GatE [Candidatus Altiarchaeales archaeon]
MKLKMNLDYEALGFKCGIEIHQQLDTHKLFCPCPSQIRDEEPDLRVTRRMRAVPGEMGEVDPAALHEFLRNQKLMYEAFEDTNCLVELDEEPPHPINEEALEVTLKFALIVSACPGSVLQVMRKTVIDGSNTSGFQRTMLVAQNGRLNTGEGEVGIPSICLEEDAARKISEKDGETVYRLDRLGIPLIEVATTPDIKNPSHARQVAEKIGEILRSLPVKRGLGTIRQDINVSIKEGARVEVKGVQELRKIPKVVEGEVVRQVMLNEVREELKRRGVVERDFKQEITDLSEIFSESKSKVISKTLGRGGGVYAVRLPGCAGLLKNKLGPELSMYAKANSNVKGLFHKDELPAYGITPVEVELVSKKTGCLGVDAFAIICGKKQDVISAFKAVLDRCMIALKHVPEETRSCLEDGSTAYMRPLPGSNRMYPETDEPLIYVTEEKLSHLRNTLPELQSEKKKRIKQMGLSAELADQLVRSRKTSLFERLADEHPEVDKTVIATTLTGTLKEAKTRFDADLKSVAEKHITAILGKVGEGVLGKDKIVEAIAIISKNPDKDVGEIIEEQELGLLSEDKIRGIVEEIIESESKIIEKMGSKGIGPLTGKVMAKTQGRANPKTVQKLLKEKL